MSDFSPDQNFYDLGDEMEICPCGMPVGECESRSPEPEKSAEHLEFLRLASSNLVKFACLWAELANVTGSSNVSSFGTLDVGGEEVSVPVSYLIWMEKQLDDMVPYLIWMEKQLDDMKTFVSGRVAIYRMLPGET